MLRLAASGPGLNLRCWLWTLKSLKETHRATEKHRKSHEHGPFRYYIETVYGTVYIYIIHSRICTDIAWCSSNEGQK